MYSEKDLQSIINQRKKRWICLGIPLALLLAAVVVSVCFRNQILTIAMTILFGGVLIAGYGLFIKPLSCYAVHLRNALHGRVLEAQVTFDHMESEKATMDGVDYYPMMCTEPGNDGKVEERLFYWDCEKKIPDVEKGTLVNVTFHDREVCDFTVA